jgi:tRNA-dihydrouridine synthase
MIGIDQVMKLTDHAKETMDFFPISDQRQWLQVITNSPNTISQLPQQLIKFTNEFPDQSNIYGININAGCPSPEIINAGEGAALIKFTSRLKHMISSFLGEIDSHPFHISVKMRLGVNAAEMKQNKFADFLNAISNIDDPRLSPTILHFKHANQTSAEPERWEFLEVALDTGATLIINGGLNSPKDLEKVKRILPNRLRVNVWNEKIRGIMIGREALKNPNVFLKFQPNLKKDIEYTWNNRIKENIELHRPADRFLSTLSELYPDIK